MKITLFDDPWPHGIIEDTYSDALFEKCQLEIEHLLPKNISTLYTEYDLQNYKHTVDCINSLDLYEVFDAVKPHFQYREFSKLFKKDTVSIAQNYPHDIHYETPTKVFSVVTYLTPDKNSGTFLYDKDKNFIKEIKWKPNTSFIFCGLRHKTWHSFTADKKHRITLNRFLERTKDDVSKYSWS